MGPKLIACSACAKAKAKCDRKVSLALHLPCRFSAYTNSVLICLGRLKMLAGPFMLALYSQESNL